MSTACLSAAVLLCAGAGTAGADVTAVRGTAYGYFSSVSLFGGPPQTRGPEPQVTLAADASNSPISASRTTGLVQFGPAIFFTSGSIDVGAQGALGPNGFASSSTSIQSINTSQQEVFTAASASSTCGAFQTVNGSTTITNGVLRTSEGNPNVNGDEVYVNVPTNPAPNTTYNGTIESVGDSFQYIFNQHIINPDGSLTVYAGHQRLLGPTAVGDLWWGKSECGRTGTTNNPGPGTTPPVTTPPATPSPAASGAEAQAGSAEAPPPVDGPPAPGTATFGRLGRLTVVDGRFGVPLGCPGSSAGCAGNVSAESANAIVAARKPRKKRILLGSAPFSLRPGESRTVSVALSRAGGRVLKRRRSLPAKITVASGASKTTRTAVLRAPKPKRKKR